MANENIDQGFNDDELEDIMSEIENLEKEFEGGESHEPAKSEDNLSLEEQAEGTVVNIEDETLVDQGTQLSTEELAIEEELQAIADLEISPEESKPNLQEQIDSDVESAIHEEPAESVVTPIKSKVEQQQSVDLGEQSLFFEVSGDIKLNMGLRISGHDVTFKISQEEGFVIALPGGGQFSIPLDTIKSMKKSA